MCLIEEIDLWRCVNVVNGHRHRHSHDWGGVRVEFVARPSAGATDVRTCRMEGLRQRGEEKYIYFGRYARCAAKNWVRARLWAMVRQRAGKFDGNSQSTVRIDEIHRQFPSNFPPASLNSLNARKMGTLHHFSALPAQWPSYKPPLLARRILELYASTYLRHSPTEPRRRSRSPPSSPSACPGGSPLRDD